MVVRESPLSKDQKRGVLSYSANRKVTLPHESPRFTHPTTRIARHCGVPRVIGADYRSLAGISPEERSGSTILSRLVIANQSSSLLQIVLFQELGPECLWRRRNVRPALLGEIHQIPIRPDCIDMIALKLSAPEMRNPSVLAPEDVHHWHLHVIRRSLTIVVRLVGGLESGDQRNLRPSAFPGPRVDFLCRCFRNGHKCRVPCDLIRASIKSIDE